MPSNREGKAENEGHERKLVCAGRLATISPKADDKLSLSRTPTQLGRGSTTRCFLRPSLSRR